MQGKVLLVPVKFLFVFLLSGSIFSAMSFAQDPAPDPAAQPEPVWSGNAGGGLSITGGNTDTTNIHLSYEIVRDPKERNVLKFYGLYLRAEQSDEVTSDRLRLGVRDEYELNERTFLFGEFSYLRDPFKEIDYLMNPVGGVGFRIFETVKVRAINEQPVQSFVIVSNLRCVRHQWLYR